MRLLLDTHVLLWTLDQPERLAPNLHALLRDGANQVMFSAASIWEIAIKAGLGRADFYYLPHEIARAATVQHFVELPIRADAAASVAQLPPYHRDPFDRLLIAQATVEGIPLHTADRQLLPYSDPVVLIS